MVRYWVVMEDEVDGETKRVMRWGDLMFIGPYEDGTYHSVQEDDGNFEETYRRARTGRNTFVLEDGTMRPVSSRPLPSVSS